MADLTLERIAELRKWAENFASAGLPYCDGITPKQLVSLLDAAERGLTSGLVRNGPDSRSRPMPNELSGAALDARFFEVCEGWKQYSMGELMLWRHNVPCDIGRMTRWEQELPEVSTDANACEAWAMRWAREQGLPWNIRNNNGAVATLYGDKLKHVPPYMCVKAVGTDWKDAFVRACVAAAQALKTNGEPKHD